ncbi:hypothetical protein EDM59_11665 [Brevibacillus nitrificans]|uniref:Uncharacterized protein n=1 Tax=Brevibacillus nitrificans TaxID=651560 RepID=A0A3M8DGU1_9BACL|nr:hypothetical protein EDM59_11665 [Brevibacillus nitrificans]
MPRTVPACGDGSGPLLPAFAGDLPEKWDTQSVREWLLMLAALLWPLDVSSRRLQLPEQW